MLIGVVFKSLCSKDNTMDLETAHFFLEASWKHLYFYADSPYKAISTISVDSFMTAVPNMTYMRPKNANHTRRVGCGLLRDETACVFWHRSYRRFGFLLI